MIAMKVTGTSSVWLPAEQGYLRLRFLEGPTQIDDEGNLHMLVGLEIDLPDDDEGGGSGPIAPVPIDDLVGVS